MHVPISLMEGRKGDAEKGSKLGRAKEKSEKQAAVEVSVHSFFPRNKHFIVTYSTITTVIQTILHNQLS